MTKYLMKKVLPTEKYLKIYAGEKNSITIFAIPNEITQLSATKAH